MLFYIIKIEDGLNEEKSLVFCAIEDLQFCCKILSVGMWTNK